MLQLFRNFFKSKIGIAVTLAFLGLIALAFASMDVANTGTFGGVTGGDRVAVVGDRRIDTSELALAATNALEQERQQNPTATMEGFIAQGGLDLVLDQLLTRNALGEFARRYGLRAGNRLVDSEIVKIQAFQGPDGKFSEDAFRAILRQRGMSEGTVRDDLALGLYASQLVTPVGLGTILPNKVATRYAQLLRERREGSIGAIPAQAFAPTGDPTDEQLQAFYAEKGDNYIRPERRVVRFATFGEEALGDLAAPTDAQIAERYRQNREQYAASETRTLTQLILPTQAAAQAIVDQVKGGSSLAAAAQSVGLQTTQINSVSQSELASQASTAAATAAFGAEQGQLSAPAQGGLGWYVFRVDTIERQAARTLAQARPEIAAALAQEQRRVALNDLTARIDEDFASGRSLGEVARELDLEVTTTEPITAAGQVYGTPQAAPPQLGRVLDVLFSMDESEPQIAEIVPGQMFLIYDVARITPSARAPLAEIRDQVVAAWRQDEGMKGAGEAANRILARVRDDKLSLADAFAAENVTLPRPETANIGRQELSQMQQVPAPLALYFSMAEGTAKRIEMAQGGSWFVVKLDDIETPELDANDPLIVATRSQLGQAAGDEYLEQYVSAIKEEVGVERNKVAIDAVSAQLTGRAN